MQEKLEKKWLYYKDTVATFFFLQQKKRPGRKAGRLDHHGHVVEHARNLVIMLRLTRPK